MKSKILKKLNKKQILIVSFAFALLIGSIITIGIFNNKILTSKNKTENKNRETSNIYKYVEITDIGEWNNNTYKVSAKMIGIDSEEIEQINMTVYNFDGSIGSAGAGAYYHLKNSNNISGFTIDDNIINFTVSNDTSTYGEVMKINENGYYIELRIIMSDGDERKSNAMKVVRSNWGGFQSNNAITVSDLDNRKVTVTPSTLNSGDSFKLHILKNNSEIKTYHSVGTENHNTVEFSIGSDVNLSTVGTYIYYATQEFYGQNYILYSNVKKYTVEPIGDIDTGLPNDELYLNINDQKQLNATFTEGSNNDSNKFNYKSDNTDVVEVDDNGVITAKAGGTATVTITSKDEYEKDGKMVPAFTKEINVTVYTDTLMIQTTETIVDNNNIEAKEFERLSIPFYLVGNIVGNKNNIEIINENGATAEVIGFEEASSQNIQSHNLIIDNIKITDDSIENNSFQIKIQKGYLENNSGDKSSEVILTVKVKDSITLTGILKDENSIISIGNKNYIVYTTDVKINYTTVMGTVRNIDTGNEIDISDSSNYTVKEEGKYEVTISSRDTHGNLMSRSCYFVILKTTPSVQTTETIVDNNNIEAKEFEKLSIPFHLVGNIVGNKNNIKIVNENGATAEVIGFEKASSPNIQSHNLIIDNIKITDDSVENNSFQIEIPKGYTKNIIDEESNSVTLTIKVRKENSEKSTYEITDDLINTDDNHKFVINVEPNTTIAEFKTEFNKLNIGNIDNVEIKDGQSEEEKNTTESLIRTGDYFKIGNITYTVIIAGDVNGDGKVDFYDIMRTIDITYKGKTKDIYWHAGNINEEHKLNLNNDSQFNFYTIMRIIYMVYGG